MVNLTLKMSTYIDDLHQVNLYFDFQLGGEALFGLVCCAAQHGF